jgi:hypothetical protein
MAIITSSVNKAPFLHAKRIRTPFYFYTIRRLILIAKQGLTEAEQNTNLAPIKKAL